MLLDAFLEIDSPAASNESALCLFFNVSLEPANRGTAGSPRALAQLKASRCDVRYFQLAFALGRRSCVNVGAHFDPAIARTAISRLGAFQQHPVSVDVLTTTR
jgi:hypothetical protein